MKYILLSLAAALLSTQITLTHEIEITAQHDFVMSSLDKINDLLETKHIETENRMNQLCQQKETPIAVIATAVTDLLRIESAIKDIQKLKRKFLTL